MTDAIKPRYLRWYDPCLVALVQVVVSEREHLSGLCRGGPLGVNVGAEEWLDGIPERSQLELRATEVCRYRPLGELGASP